MTVFETISVMLLFTALVVDIIFGLLSLIVELIKLYNDNSHNKGTSKSKTNTKK